MPIDPATQAKFQGIKRFIVLMLENRSFDHLFGYLKATNPKVWGLTGNEFNQKDPNSPSDPAVKVQRASSFVMTFDPAHEYYDVQMQLYGPLAGTDPGLPPIANPRSDPAPMTGFITSATQAVDFSGDENLVMGCFQPDQLPVISTLAAEFGLFNFWYSSLPGPTWPNRFFIHAATSGGLTDSPSNGQVLAGFTFQNGTIYERLNSAGKDWCIYHDGLPQTAGLSNLRDEFVNPFTEKFQDMDDFFEDVKKGELSEYNFIEPRYDTGNNYLDGNSMHPLNDIRKGEALVKQVYESLRNSSYWAETMLIITFDEHGGFYDHQPPPVAVPTGDDSQYANINYIFPFDQLGVRVPALVISAYTAKGTVIGTDPNDPSTVFDHTSVLATVETLFGMKPLTKRDAQANTLEVAMNQAAPRLSPQEALTTLPAPAADAAAAPANPADIFAAAPQAPLSTNQSTMAALALACDLKMTRPEYHAALISNHQKLVEQKDAADYIQSVESKVAARRAAAPVQ
ncbi:MAG TPA: alkaline phosphatase family protein [Verrucomicrobiae bacterium]|nr:alkaline phosphatase family protein [Verrucomicrobiae bacterium]